MRINHDGSQIMTERALADGRRHAGSTAGAITLRELDCGYESAHDRTVAAPASDARHRGRMNDLEAAERYGDQPQPI